MSREADPLRALVVDTRQVNREKLASLLSGKVLLDLEADSFLFASEARTHFSARKAILIALLAKKALSLLKDTVPDVTSPKELAAATGEKGNTIRPALGRLVNEGLVIRQPKGYTVHVSALARVASVLTQE